MYPEFFSGLGAGLFVFPSNGKPLPQVASVVVRFSVRDCVTGLPWGTLPEVSPVESLNISVRFKEQLDPLVAQFHLDKDNAIKVLIGRFVSSCDLFPTP